MVAKPAGAADSATTATAADEEAPLLDAPERPSLLSVAQAAQAWALRMLATATAFFQSEGAPKTAFQALRVLAPLTISAVTAIYAARAGPAARAAQASVNHDCYHQFRGAPRTLCHASPAPCILCTE